MWSVFSTNPTSPLNTTRGVVKRVESMLGSSKLAAFVGTTDADRAKGFYRDILGLNLVREEPNALVFDCNGTRLRVSLVTELAPAKYTVLGWEVQDIRGTIEALAKRGVSFERYDFMKQDDLGVWTAPSGARVAWFKDPDGNLLSVSRLEESAP
jgi:catechol 2,3-dioxygenase-like lactoylglutathione lyase family enzyme